MSFHIENMRRMAESSALLDDIHVELLKLRDACIVSFDGEYIKPLEALIERIELHEFDRVMTEEQRKEVIEWYESNRNNQSDI